MCGKNKKYYIKYEIFFRLLPMFKHSVTNKEFASLLPIIQ